MSAARSRGLRIPCRRGRHGHCSDRRNRDAYRILDSIYGASMAVASWTLMCRVTERALLCPGEST